MVEKIAKTVKLLLNSPSFRLEKDASEIIFYNQFQLEVCVWVTQTNKLEMKIFVVENNRIKYVFYLRELGRIDDIWTIDMDKLTECARNVLNAIT